MTFLNSTVPLFLAGLLTCADGSTAEMKFSGISLPFFGPDGRPTHRLTAAEGRLAEGQQQLRGVEVVYFSATDPAVVIQRVTATEARWDAGKKTLTGSGAIAVSSGENQLIGEGFDFALGTSLLHIHRNFTMTNPEVRLTSDRATVELVVERGSESVKFRDVRRCEATGNLQVHIQPGARNKYPFEHAASHLAVYEGETKVITFPQKTRVIAKGVEATFLKTEIDLKPKPGNSTTK